MPLFSKVCKEGLTIPFYCVVVYAVCDGFKGQSSAVSRVTFGALREVRTLECPAPFVSVRWIIADGLEA